MLSDLISKRERIIQIPVVWHWFVLQDVNWSNKQFNQVLYGPFGAQSVYVYLLIQMAVFSSSMTTRNGHLSLTTENITSFGEELRLI